MAAPPLPVPSGLPRPPRPPAPLPPALRWLGPPLAAGFGAAVGLRRWAYAWGWKKARRAPLPVISVGNLTVGGTGKTPAVAYLARELLARGLAKKPAVLMRGYGAARPGAANDEARELARALPGVPVLAHPKRYEGACAAREKGCDVALLDDGFQHWALARDLDCVLLDASDPFGGGHLLPWGRLRERPAALARAGAVIFTRCELAAPARLDETLLAPLQALAAGAVFAQARHAPAALRRLWSEQAPQAPEALSGKKILAACALGHPAAFRETLQRLGARLAVARTFADHHRYTAEDLAGLLEAARRAGAEGVVVSEKDAVKLEALPEPGAEAPPVWALRIRFELLAGEAELWARIEAALRAARERARPTNG